MKVYLKPEEIESLLESNEVEDWLGYDFDGIHKIWQGFYSVYTKDGFQLEIYHDRREE